MKRASQNCHARVMLLVPESAVAPDSLAYSLQQPESHAVVLALAESKQPGWMLQHQLEGHPYDKRCPWCVQGRLKQQQHRKQISGAGVNLAGSTVKCDLSGPHESGVTGSVWAMIGVHIDSSWGYVGLQRDKSAQSTLASLQSL